MAKDDAVARQPSVISAELLDRAGQRVKVTMRGSEGPLTTWVVMTAADFARFCQRGLELVPHVCGL